MPFILTFIAIFVAVDAIGNIPVFISLMEGVSKKQKDKVIRDSVSTATVIAILFMFIGKIVLRFIGITIADFQIAGGSLLFLISARLLLPIASSKVLANAHGRGDFCVFPLGTPLITGPAVLTTTLMMVDSYGMFPTFVSLLANLLIVWITLVKSDLFIKLMGERGLRAVSKIMYILLAAIGVMMVRRGILNIIRT